MEQKKRPILIIVVIILALVNILNLLVVTGITGGDVAQGITSLCIDFPPVITAIPDKTATISSLFTYQVLVTDDDDNNLTYYDDTSLFNIGSTGLISFTPAASSTQTIEITVEDNVGCVSANSTEQFILTISAAAPAAEEEAAAAPSAEGGGGGAPAAKRASFQISEEIIKVALKQNQLLEKRLKITNDGDKTLKMEIINPLGRVLTIFPLTFILAPREEQEIILTFNPDKEALPNVYFNQIEITGTVEEEYVKKSLTAAIEIESVEVSFDVSLDLAVKEFYPGDELKATVTVFNLNEIYPLDVKVVYMILNSNNELVYESEETITLQERVSFSKAMNLAEAMQPGRYLLVIKVPYEETLATASEMFTVKAPPSALAELIAPVTEQPYLVGAFIPLILILALVSLIILYLVYRKVKSAKTKTIIKNKTVMQPNIILNEDLSSLKRKLALLKESHRRGFIKEDTYRRTKEKLERLIKKERGKE